MTPAPGYGPGAYWPGPWGAAPTVEDEVVFLKDEAEALRSYLEGIERRISDLDEDERLNEGAPCRTGA